MNVKVSVLYKFINTSIRNISTHSIDKKFYQFDHRNQFLIFYCVWLNVRTTKTETLISEKNKLIAKHIYPLYAIVFYATRTDEEDFETRQ